MPVVSFAQYGPKCRGRWNAGVPLREGQALADLISVKPGAPAELTRRHRLPRAANTFPPSSFRPRPSDAPLLAIQESTPAQRLRRGSSGRPAALLAAHPAMPSALQQRQLGSVHAMSSPVLPCPRGDAEKVETATARRTSKVMRRSRRASHVRQERRRSVMSKSAPSHDGSPGAGGVRDPSAAALPKQPAGDLPSAASGRLAAIIAAMSDWHPDSDDGDSMELWGKADPRMQALLASSAAGGSSDKAASLLSPRAVSTAASAQQLGWLRQPVSPSVVPATPNAASVPLSEQSSAGLPAWLPAPTDSLCSGNANSSASLEPSSATSGTRRSGSARPSVMLRLRSFLGREQSIPGQGSGSEAAATATAMASASMPAVGSVRRISEEPSESELRLHTAPALMGTGADPPPPPSPPQPLARQTGHRSSTDEARRYSAAAGNGGTSSRRGSRSVRKSSRRLRSRSTAAQDGCSFTNADSGLYYGSPGHSRASSVKQPVPTSGEDADADAHVQLRTILSMDKVEAAAIQRAIEERSGVGLELSDRRAAPRGSTAEATSVIGTLRLAPDRRSPQLAGGSGGGADTATLVHAALQGLRGDLSATRDAAIVRERVTALLGPRAETLTSANPHPPSAASADTRSIARSNSNSGSSRPACPRRAGRPAGRGIGRASVPALPVSPFVAGGEEECAQPLGAAQALLPRPVRASIRSVSVAARSPAAASPFAAAGVQALAISEFRSEALSHAESRSKAVSPAGRTESTEPASRDSLVHKLATVFPITSDGGTPAAAQAPAEGAVLQLQLQMPPVSISPVTSPMISPFATQASISAQGSGASISPQGSGYTSPFTASLTRFGSFASAEPGLPTVPPPQATAAVAHAAARLARPVSLAALRTGAGGGGADGGVREIAVLQRLRHPHIIALHEVSGRLVSFLGTSLLAAHMQ